MAAITRNLSTAEHKLAIDGQIQDFQMVPQYISSLRDDLILFDGKSAKPAIPSCSKGGQIYQDLYMTANRTLDRNSKKCKIPKRDQGAANEGQSDQANTPSGLFQRAFDTFKKKAFEVCTDVARAVNRRRLTWN